MVWGCYECEKASRLLCFHSIASTGRSDFCEIVLGLSWCPFDDAGQSGIGGDHAATRHLWTGGRTIGRGVTVDRTERSVHVQEVSCARAAKVRLRSFRRPFRSLVCRLVGVVARRLSAARAEPKSARSLLLQAPVLPHSPTHHPTPHSIKRAGHAVIYTGAGAAAGRRAAQPVRGDCSEQHWKQRLPVQQQQLLIQQ